jgi:hypothetical protein
MQFIKVNVIIWFMIGIIIYKKIRIAIFGIIIIYISIGVGKES